MDTRAELATRALRETLDSLLSPTLRDTLIGEALALAREGAIPDDPVRFRDFLMGPLALALERALGMELGRSVLQELERVTERLLPRPSFVSLMPPPPRRARITTSPSGAARLLGNHPRAARSPSAQLHGATASRELPRTEPPPNALPSTMRPPPSRSSFVERAPSQSERGQAALTETRVPHSGDLPAGLSWAISDVPSSAPDSLASTARRLPLVLLSTRDSELVQRFAAWLDPRAAVVRVSRLTEIVGDLDLSPRRRALIVLDCREPLVRPQALAGLADELPENVRVALWGAQASLLRVLHQISPQTSRWVVFSPEMAETDLAERCVEMVG